MQTSEIRESLRERPRLGSATTVLLGAIALLMAAGGWLFVEVGRLKLPKEVSIETVDKRIDENATLVSGLAADMTHLSSQITSLAVDLAYVEALASNADFYAHSHTYSDGRIKQNVDPIHNALEDILQVTGVRFEWNHQLRADLPKGSQIGVIAQQVMQVFPELVHAGPGGYLYVDYALLAPVLIEAIREQQAQIDHLTEEVSFLRGQLQHPGLEAGRVELSLE